MGYRSRNISGECYKYRLVQAYGYGQGIPDIPVVARERTASTLSSLITDRKGVTIAVTAEPGTGRDPWPKDKRCMRNGNSDCRL